MSDTDWAALKGLETHHPVVYTAILTLAMIGYVECVDIVKDLIKWFFTGK